MKHVFENKRISAIVCVLPDKVVRYADELEDYNFPVRQSEMLGKMMDDYIWNSEYGLGYARRKVEQIWEEYNEFIHKPLNDIIPFGMFKTAWDSLFGWIPYSVADPKTMNIFELMELLDTLADCAFSICNFATSVLTYKQDKKTKMFIDFDSEVPVPPTALTGVYKLNAEFNQLVGEWRNSATSGLCVS